MTRWGAPGHAVEIFGQGFTNLVGVTFGTGVASFNVISDTELTALVPANGTTGFVTVTTQSGSLTSSQKFFVTPVVTGLSAASGAVGTQVTISGAGFVGTSVVKFGGAKAASFTADSSGLSITATVPVGAKTGKIAITTPGWQRQQHGDFHRYAARIAEGENVSGKHGLRNLSSDGLLSSWFIAAQLKPCPSHDSSSVRAGAVVESRVPILCGTGLRGCWLRCRFLIPGRFRP